MSEETVRGGAKWNGPVVALAGGVGGAKLAAGLARALPPGGLDLVVNTGDDCDLFGLRVCPDLDTVLYTLGGLANPLTGWGVVDDTFTTLELLGRYGADTWFRLGDRDLATHIRRTQLLKEGRSLTEVMGILASSLGVSSRLLPMSNSPIATLIDTPAGRLEFQDYFVRRHQQDDVLGVVFAGIEGAIPTPAVVQALESAAAIIFCPSNPIVSIGPILAVAGLRETIKKAKSPRIAISPIIGGQALKGPAAQMLLTLGHEVSSFGVALLYQDILDGFMIDEIDEALAPRIEALGLKVLVAPTIMQGEEDRVRLAQTTLEFARELSRKEAR